MATDDINHWVFGYGSLIWRPGFVYLRAAQATLAGAHRSLCVYSHRHRGTAEQPGLVFGLTHGGSCRGMAFQVEHARWPETLAYLRERELDKGVYREVFRPIRIEGLGTVTALAFVVDEHHPQFAGRLSIEEQARLVRIGRGESGANIEYVLATARHLEAMGIVDPYLRELVALLEA